MGMYDGAFVSLDSAVAECNKLDARRSDLNQEVGALKAEVAALKLAVANRDRVIAGLRRDREEACRELAVAETAYDEIKAEVARSRDFARSTFGFSFAEG